MRKIFRRSCVIISVVFIVDTLAVSLWLRLIISQETDFYPDEVQVGIVLNGDANENFTDIGPETQRRLNHTLHLYQDGRLDNIICVGGARPKLKFFGSEYMKKFLISKGIHPEKILTEKISNDSISNWQVASSFIQSKDWDTVVIISSPIHIQRLRKIVSLITPKDLVVYFYPYSYKNCQPKITPLELWYQIHYEWLVYIIYYCLPRSFYRYIIHMTRK